MNGADAPPWAGVQSLVLKPSKQDGVLHQMLSFPDAAAGHAFLAALQPLGGGLSWGAARPGGPRAERALGLTYRGLEVLGVPERLLRELRKRSPAFFKGAARRAARHLGDTSECAAEHWEPAFEGGAAHALLTVHGDAHRLAAARERLGPWLQACGVAPLGRCYEGWTLRPATGGPGQWLHFGYRDGLARPVVRGVKGSQDVHAPGELLLGHARNDGSVPWDLTALPPQDRRFFADGSFGVFRPLRQDVAGFERAVTRWARAVGDFLGPQQAADLEGLRSFVKAKLCGRWPDGQVVRPEDTPRAPSRGPIDDDFGFTTDARGEGCPYASHVRRMNPRGTAVLDRSRRPLFRRGMAFGPIDAPAGAPPPERGLLALFFCASLEEQCEHLLGQWGVRLPPGAPDDSRARDPFMGAHETAAAAFRIRFQERPEALALTGLRSFVRTLGTAYAFYPAAGGFEWLMQRARA